MITGDQSRVVEFLASAAAHGGAPVERIDTHAAIVFLAGSRALKLKRAVRFDYLDFSTAERRRTMCEAEVCLNRRTAPSIYRGVLAVTREAGGSLALGGGGEPVDWVVDMNRFEQDALFDRLASRGRLDVGLMDRLAAAVARLHETAERRSDHGGRAGMAWVIDGNAAGFAEFGANILDPGACAALTAAAQAELDRRAAQLDARRAAGFVRQCHGDLHLRNIVLLDGAPTLFDAVEFNDEIACVDVLYDLAFLLMDLWRRGLPEHASRVWNGYLAETATLDGLSLLPLFLSCRAAVRAKTSATAASMQSDAARRAELEALARRYLAMAADLLRPAGPCLIAIGGPSGTGKSSLAQSLAAAIGAVPGAVVLRSDRVRKRLAGVPPLQRLGPEGYGAEMTARVYETIAHEAGVALAAGHAAIVDAVYARPADRARIERAAADAGAPFAGIWLEAPEGILIARVRGRRGDPSDADEAVVRMQLSAATGAIGWHRLDASPPLEQVSAAALAWLRGRGIGIGGSRQ